MLRYNDTVRGELFVKPQERPPTVRRGGSLRLEPTSTDSLREEIQSHRRCESLKIPRARFGASVERKLSFKRPSLVPEIENGEDEQACISSSSSRREDRSPKREFNLSPRPRRLSGLFAQSELNGGGELMGFREGFQNGLLSGKNGQRRKSVDFNRSPDGCGFDDNSYFKRTPMRSGSLKTELYSTRRTGDQEGRRGNGFRVRSMSVKCELLKPVLYNDSVQTKITEAEINAPPRGAESIYHESTCFTPDTLLEGVQLHARSPANNGSHRSRCYSAPSNADIMNYLMDIEERISRMDRRLDWITLMDENISTGEITSQEMTKESREMEPGERKMSVPRIYHEIEGEILNIPENKLIQRRRLMHGEGGKLSPNCTAHGRSCSFRNRPRPKLLNVDIDRPRRSSLPSPSANLLSVSFDDIHGNKENAEPLRRVRSFKTTTKGGVINRGDSFKRSSHSVNSTGSAVITENSAGGGVAGMNGHSNSRQRIDSTNSKDSGTASTSSSLVPAPAVYRVAVLGDKGVGKTSLTSQFMTSEFVAFENEDNDDENTDRHVTVLLNAEESTLEFVDRPMDNAELSNNNVDAFGVVYSITDRASFQAAVDQLYTIRHELDRTDKPCILIANKIDLVRKRKVAREEGRSVAKQYDCKYTEASAALNHHVDELLVGFLSQIRMKITPGIKMDPPSFPTHGKAGKQIMAGPKRFFHKLFKKNIAKTAVPECENLFME